MLVMNMKFIQGILFVRLKGILNDKNSVKLDKKLSSLIRNNGIKYVLLNLNNIECNLSYDINLFLNCLHNINKQNGKLIIVYKEKITNNNKVSISLDNFYQITKENIAFSLVKL